MKTTKINVPLKLRQVAEAEANPLITWMEFVFTDDKPNVNSQGVKQNSFASIIDTGMYMPVKMEEGKIGGHSLSKPIGTIKHLEHADSEVVGVAAVWNKERPSDIALLRESYANGEPLNISFELQYVDFEIDDDGVEWLVDPTVRAATIVSNPAYGGRTPIISLASDKNATNLPDSSFAFIEAGGVLKDGITHPRALRHFPYKDAEGEVSEELLIISLKEIETVEFNQKDSILEVLKTALSEYDKEKQSLMEKEKILELETTASTLRERIEELEGKLNELVTERDVLLSYKEKRELQDTQAETLKARLDILSKAGFTYDAEQVTAKSEYWLQFDDSAFTNYVDDIKTIKDAKAGSNLHIPDASGSNSGSESNIDILRNHFIKKNGEADNGNS